MKKILLSIIALCCIVVAGAQNSSQQQTAILQTGDGDPTIFYGVDALKNAYNAAAQEGSVITLTSGTFNSPNNIKKSVSIYGVGFEDNITENVRKTNINGWLGFYADADGNVTRNSKLEGVYVNGNIDVNHSENLTIAKCQFSSLIMEGTGVDGLRVRQSYLTGGIDARNYYIGNMVIKNCYISGQIVNLTSNSQALFDHCILRHYSGSDTNYAHAAAFYTNCIINNHDRYNEDPPIETGYTTENCIFFTNEGNVKKRDGERVNNKYAVDFSTLFGDGVNNIDYSTARSFILADPDTYKGTDGTPVGVTGGDYPWYKVPSIPYVKNLNATVNGASLDVNYDAGVGSTNPPTD